MATDAPQSAFEAYADEPVPQASVGAPGKDGRLELTFAPDATGRTRLVHDLARVPFHVSGTLDHDPHPDATTVYVQSPTGGIAQGDRHAIEVTAQADTVAHVSTSSATKVLTMERNYAAADVSLVVESGGHLEYLPEPTILHRGARFCQNVTVTVASNATAVLGEVVVPGRLARDERFDFERFASRLRVHDREALLFEDATHLHPDLADPTVPGVLGEHVVYGSLYVVVPRYECDEIEPLADGIHERVATADTAARTTATVLPNDAGVLVRALADGTEPVADALWHAWDEARRELLDVPAPEVRKQ